ncbi:MAG TPA: sugar ABC transporter substrate-binding protein [Streptosporangiaceae bacterium]|nr:sugar ABC transporter substrate-binding protein [Streptosporangiaceae bacterium]
MKGIKLLSCMAALTVAAGMAACSSSSSPGSSSGGKVHLTYALWDPNEEVGYKKSIAIFEKSHPNISVTVVQIPYPNYQEKLQAEFTSGSGPDIFWVNTPWLSTWIKDGLMVNLAPDIAKAHINMSQYIPSLVSLHTYNGAIYGLPKDWDTIAVYYNENYFAQHHIPVPTTWSWNTANGGTFLKVLQEATIDKNGNNALSPKFNPSAIATYGAEMDNAMQTGWGSFLAEDGVYTIPKAFASSVSFNTPKADQVFQFIRNLMYKWHVMIPGAELGSNATDPSSENNALFAAGKIAMQIGGDWETTGTFADVGSKFKIGVIPLPAGPDGTWSVFNGLIDAINPHSPHFQQAWELEQWLGSEASQKIMGEGGYVWPAIPSLDPLFASYWAAKGVSMSGFLSESKGNLLDWPNTPGMNQGLTDMARDMGPIWLGPGTLAQTSANIAQAATDANHDLSSAGG